MAMLPQSLSKEDQSSLHNSASSEKAVAEIIPVIGAAGGLFVNSVFIHHFQELARSHFTIRRLERKYCPEVIQSAYERLKAKPRTH